MEQLLKEKEKYENIIWNIEMQDYISQEDWHLIREARKKIKEIDEQIKSIEETHETLENGF